MAAVTTYIGGIDWSSSPDFTVIETMLPIDKVKFYARRFISAHEDLRHDYGVMVDHTLTTLAEEIEVRLQRDIVATHPNTRTFRWPADWWQAVKERFAPAWFKGRWPVIYTVETLEFRLMFPDAPPPSVLGRSVKWTSFRLSTEACL